MRERIVIVGGGVSGLTAAIGGARNGAHVTIMEHMDQVGKKVLSTGNSRHNLANLRMGEDCYRCGQKGFPMEVIRGLGVDKTLAFFRGLGMEPKNRSGCIYPNSDQASAVLDVLRSGVERLGVVVLFSCRVERIEPTASGDGVRYKVHMDQGILGAEVVILAADSRVAPSIGSNGGGYELARRLGHRITRSPPALVQLQCQGSTHRQIADIRTEAGVKLIAADELLGRDRGELQLTSCDLSDIPVFQVNRFAARILDQGKKVTASVDFMPSRGGSEVFGLPKKRASLPSRKTAEEPFTGLLNKKPALVLIRLAGVRLPQEVGDLSPRQLKPLLGQTKSYEAAVMSVNPFVNAQMCRGDMDTKEVDATTMESGICTSLYLAGELLDVGEIYGGYNLQFTWSSGMIARMHAAKGYFMETHGVDRNRVETHGAYGPALGGKKNRK